MALEASNEAVTVSGRSELEVREKLTRGYNNVTGEEKP